MPHGLQLFSYILSAEVMSSRKGSTESEIAAARARTKSIRERLAARRRKRNDLIAAATQNALPLKNPDISVVAALSTSGKPSKTLVSSTTQLASESVIDASSSVKGAEHLMCGQKCVPDVGDVPIEEESCVSSDEPPSKALEVGPDTDPTDLEILLSALTAKEREVKREKILDKKFRSCDGSQVQLFCVHGTRVECQQGTEDKECTKLHFKKIIQAHTDECLGDCSFLNTCFHVDTCKFVHYEIDAADPTTAEAREAAGAYNRGQLRPDSLDKGKGDLAVEKTAPATARVPLYPPQCDIRPFDMTILGKFAVIMADPPWGIHMELPYSTISDDEMRRMDIPCLQDDGYMFLCVTGRARELGRECLRLWGYERVDKVMWVKTNQLQCLRCTGRTGHWVNHGKEHCVVGEKGSPRCMNRGLDSDVIVLEVRETSRKPDKIHGLIERLSSGTRKLELFGRPHKLQANWVTVGNQLDGTYLVDAEAVERYRRRYPNGIDKKGDAL
ncbi:N6-adenosine-methyltransferase subunit [Echinococcus granulosus]|uniref:mRNA m(6)A methyltransferase n=1 Tax=Echinococcus granulosus TaxID=6210 RepID=W6U7A0_ECHGR|nr:N6-adenosine-methyltransferase subunit [Echinococcus granulosus]EUB56246.1 N6-adenosine-methyltransferase subunit [Echinococcus granulosus]